MASHEGIGYPFLRQPSARSPKLRAYESLFLLNEGIDHVTALLRDMEKLPFADKEFGRVRHHRDRRGSLRHERRFHRPPRG